MAIEVGNLPGLDSDKKFTIHSPSPTQEAKAHAEATGGSAGVEKFAESHEIQRNCEMVCIYIHIYIYLYCVCINSTQYIHMHMHMHVHILVCV